MTDTEREQWIELAGEEWMPVPDFDNGYSVSNMGRIRRNDSGKIYTGYGLGKGHLSFCFSFNGTRKRYLVHRVVAEVFIPNTFKRPYVNHIDGNRKNNRVSNLEWCTQSENIIHACANGFQEQSLNPVSVRIIRRCLGFGMTASGLSKMLGFEDTGSGISRMRRGDTWSWVDCDTPLHEVASNIRSNQMLKAFREMPGVGR